MRLMNFLALTLALMTSGCSKPSYSTDVRPPAQQEVHVESEVKKDVPYVPTSHEIVAKMLEMARVDQNDLVYDLGSGDGRIVIAAARDFGARGVGIEIDPVLIAEAEQNARDARVADRVRFIRGDLFEQDLHPATAVTLYLLPSVNLKLRPKLLEELRPGTPVVSHDFDMDQWEADEKGGRADDELFLWIIPAKVQGSWVWTLPNEGEQRLEITQKFQQISGKVGERAIENASLRGEAIAFELGKRRYAGRVLGDWIVGTVEPLGSGQKTSWRARRAP